MPALPYSISISDEERAYLKSLIKTRTIQAQIVDRARMLLWKSEAKTDKAIADGLGVSVNTVRRCIDRYLNSGINLAIFDDERSGRPVEITDDAKSWIVSISKRWILNLSRSNIILNGKTLILRIRCMMSSWFINRLKCSLTIMGRSLYQKAGI